MYPLSPPEFERISSIALAEAGLSLPPAKQVFVSSRLQRRLRATGMQDFSTYLSLIDAGTSAAATEKAELISALTTNVTGPFREIHHFATLAQFLREGSTACAPVNGVLRIWSAGCSTGEEALSIAAVCHAVLGRSWTQTVRILATDIDKKVLKRATARTEEPALLEQLLAGLQASVVLPGPAPTLQVAELHKSITYMQHNLLEPLPVDNRFDIIFCRNVTIYFEQGIQRRVHAHLQRCLAPGGLLIIGHSERLLSPDRDIRLIGTTTYRKDPDPDGAVKWP